MSRVDAARIAAWKASEAAEAAGEAETRTAGAVVASDAFFPFADGLLATAAAGVTAVIQPGGCAARRRGHRRRRRGRPRHGLHRDAPLPALTGARTSGTRSSSRRPATRKTRIGAMPMRWLPDESVSQPTRAGPMKAVTRPDRA